jgi:hypothetical protein
MPNAECRMWDDGDLTCTWTSATPKSGLEQFRSLSKAVDGCYAKNIVREASEDKSLLLVVPFDKRSAKVEVEWKRDDIEIDLTLTVYREDTEGPKE